MIATLKQVSKWNWLTIFIFCFIFVIGVCTVSDYGISEDELYERNHSLVNHYYLRSVMKGNFSGNGIPIESKSSNLEKLIDRLNVERNTFQYPYKYYGVAIQLPMTFVEQIFHYKLDVSTIYLIRHIWTFFIYFVSLIFFYFLLKKYVIKNQKYALIGVLFLVLSPRIYGESFFNIKDLVFMSLCIIDIYFCLEYLNCPSKKHLILMCFFSSLVINCRVVGALIFFLTLIFKISKFKFNFNQKNFVSIIGIVLLTYAFYIILTPTSWNNPIFFPFEVMNFFFNYRDPFSFTIHKCFYFGQSIISTNLPWHYLPVWIIITTPIFYIALSGIGVVSQFIRNRKKKVSQININYWFCNILLILVLLFVMLVRPTLYTGWRHFYFLYPLIIINTVVGLRAMVNYSKKLKWLVVLLSLLNCIYILGWMVENHPYQYEYFSLLFRNFSIKNFETNYWHVSNRDAFVYISNHSNNRVKVYPDDKFSYSYLSKKQRKRIKLVRNMENAYYVINNNPDGNSSLELIYDEVTYKKIDGYRLYTIYKKKKG